MARQIVSRAHRCPLRLSVNALPAHALGRRLRGAERVADELWTQAFEALQVLLASSGGHRGRIAARAVATGVDGVRLVNAFRAVLVHCAGSANLPARAAPW